MRVRRHVETITAPCAIINYKPKIATVEVGSFGVERVIIEERINHAHDYPGMAGR